MYLTDKHQKSEGFKIITIAAQHSKINSEKTGGGIGGGAIRACQIIFLFMLSRYIFHYLKKLVIKSFG